MKSLRWIAGFAVLVVAVGPAVAQGGPGLHTTPLVAGQWMDAGTVSMWNSPQKMILQIEPTSMWKIKEYQIYMGTDPVPTKKGNPVPGQFPFKREMAEPVPQATESIDLADDLGFSWGSQSIRLHNVAVHVDLVRVDLAGNVLGEEGAWAHGPNVFEGSQWGWWLTYELAHPNRGQFIDSPVQGLSFHGPTQMGVTGPDELSDQGGFLFFPGEVLDFSIGSVPLGSALGAKKVSPLDLFSGADLDDPRVLGVARTLQTLDNDHGDGKIVLLPEVVACFEGVVGSMGLTEIDFGNGYLVYDVLSQTVVSCNGLGGAELELVSQAEAQGNLEAGLNASGIFRKNMSKTEEWGEDKHKEEVMPVYLPGLRSNGDPSYCDLNANGVYDEGLDQLGVVYEEWRLNGDPLAQECDPRLDESCVVTIVECREVAKPLLVTYKGEIDIHDDQVTTEFSPGRFSFDIFTAVSRDDGTTWKRMNVSRMADLSSFELETGEPFPGTNGSPYLKVDDNNILVVWESKYCKSGNPRYAITKCDDPATPEVETPESGCAVYCQGNPDQGTEVCEPDYSYDDAYYVTDIWGVRGQQQSVNYDEVDDVADLGIGEIPYSCLWAARGVIVTQKELDEGTFASMIPEDDPATAEDESDVIAVGDIVWYKPERITSGRRDAYVPMVNSARGAGFAIVWQEDPEGLRPGKGKGTGEGWSGAISNHKTDIWYTFIRTNDFAVVDENFIPGGTPDPDRPGLGRPKALVPFALPVRVSDNDMVNTDTLKVQLSSQCVIPTGGTEQVCFPEVADGTFVPLDPEVVANSFCDGPNPVANCCDPDHMKSDDPLYDPDCEDVKGLYGNLTGTKRYAYLARSVDDDGDGVPDYQYYVDRGGTLDLCDLTGANSYMDQLPGTNAHERWFGFANVEGSSKLVCVTSDGRLLDGDVFAVRPMIQLQPYTKPDGTKSAWALLAYEESKGLGHSLAASEHDNDDELINTDPGQDKPIKQDLGKNLLYHSFDFTQPDLVSPGHVLNLPALCGGLYPTWCDDPDNPTCTCTLGQPVPLYFDYELADGTWMPDPTKFLQYRTEIARRTRFLMQSPGKMGANKTLGAIIYKQGQEGQGRPADVFIRRVVKAGTGNPYQFANIECNQYLDETFTLPACPNGAGDKPSAVGYSCNVWGEASGDRLCGGIFYDPNGGYPRRDHINLTSSDIDLSVDAGPVDDTPDDPTDDVYGTDKVLLWTQNEYNLGDESYGAYDGAGLSGMFSNAKSQRGFIRGDFLVTAYAWTPNWAASRNGNDRYNFYVRRSFDGGQTWTTTPATLGGDGVYYCREWRSDPTTPDEDGTGNAPPVFPGFDPTCVAWCAEGDTTCVETGTLIGAGTFEPGRNVSEINNNKESSGDPRVGATPPTYPLDGRVGTLPILRFVEDEYVDNIFFVAWGTVDNAKSTGSTGAKPEGSPLDLYYTRSADYGDEYLKVPWNVNPQGNSQNWDQGELVWRYDFIAQGDPERQGEAQLRATSDGSKVYAFYHQNITPEPDPDEVYTRWYPWKPEVSFEDDLWFRRIIFWPTTIVP